MRKFVIVCGFLGLMNGAVQAQSTDANGVCVGDANGNAQVSVNELVTAVNNAIEGCPQQSVSISFKGMVADQPFQCGSSYPAIGTTAKELIPADFRFYVSDVRLVTTSGQQVPVALTQDGVWQQRNVALLDFENKTPPCAVGNEPTNDRIVGTAPPGEYRGIRFTVGVPFDLNHANAATAETPLNITAMFWNWQLGYKFFRLDALDSDFNPIRLHVGSTGCALSAPNQVTHCSNPNRAEIILEDFDASADVIVADLAELLIDSDIGSNVPDTAPGCESGRTDMDCDPIFRHLGINFANGLPDPSRQTFFRVEPASEVRALHAEE